MPYLHIQTNQALEPAEQQQILADGEALISQALGKSIAYVMTSLEAEACLRFAGSDDPCAYMEVKSLGLSTQQAKQLSARLAEFSQTRLNVPASRLYIEFANPERALWGFNGGTLG